MQSKKELNSIKRDLIHNNAISIINILSHDTIKTAEITGHKFKTAQKKTYRTDDKVFTKEDLSKLNSFLEEKSKEIMIKRREIKEFLNEL